MILDIGTSLLILLFAYTAFDKFINYSAFEDQLYQSPLTRSFSKYLSVLLPLLELLAVILMLFPSYKKAGLLLSTLLMLMFTGYVAAVLIFIPDNNRPCSCGGIFRFLSWSQHLFLNSIFSALALICVKTHNTLKNNISYENPSTAVAASARGNRKPEKE